VPTQSDRRLYQSVDLVSLLQLTEEQVNWLVETDQLRPIHICGQVRFDSKDISHLIDVYKTTQSRKQ
jgi:hypothetical protein